MQRRIPERLSDDFPVADGRPRNLRRESGDGLRWVYRHRVLGPLTLTTHGWFLCNSMATTVLVPFALLGLHLSAFELGATLAATWAVVALAPEPADTHSRALAVLVVGAPWVISSPTTSATAPSWWRPAQGSRWSPRAWQPHPSGMPGTATLQPDRHHPGGPVTRRAGTSTVPGP